MSSDSKVHAFQEVAKHNTKDDCWLIINGKNLIIATICIDVEAIDRNFVLLFYIRFVLLLSLDIQKCNE
ncbi:Cytochrome b5 [Bienertia sinuspersici]